MRGFDGIAGSADMFHKQLMQEMDEVQRQYENLVTRVVLKVFKKILDRSPVDTGQFKASNRLTKGYVDPTYFTGEFSGKTKVGRARQALAYARQQTDGWRWRLEDGMIYFTNNCPHAQLVEKGTASPQNAPQGVYRVTLAEFTLLFERERRRYPLLR